MLIERYSVIERRLPKISHSEKSAGSANELESEIGGKNFMAEKPELNVGLLLFRDDRFRVVRNVSGIYLYDFRTDLKDFTTGEPIPILSMRIGANEEGRFYVRRIEKDVIVMEPQDEPGLGKMP